MYKVYKNVLLGKNCQIQEGVILGLPPTGKSDGELKTLIGNNAVIRSNTVIYAGTKIGDNFQSGHNVVIREGNKIGNEVNVWSNTVLSPGNTISDNVRIHANCFLEYCQIGEGVFIGPGTVFTDDPHPVCPKWKECVLGAKVEKNVSIGANATILPGVKIGEGAVIGAGSVVTTSVLKGNVVAGNPARKIKKVAELSCFKGFYKRPYEWRSKK